MDERARGETNQRPLMKAEKLITFLYCKDLSAAMRFYEETLGLVLAIDQGIFRLWHTGPLL